VADGPERLVAYPNGRPDRMVGINRNITLERQAVLERENLLRAAREARDEAEAASVHDLTEEPKTARCSRASTREPTPTDTRPRGCPVRCVDPGARGACSSELTNE